MRKAINPPNAPSAIGTYNQGIETDGLVFTSGQVGIDPSTGQLVDGGIDMQTAQTLKNIEVILSSLDLGKESIVKLTVFLKNLDGNDNEFVEKEFFVNTNYRKIRKDLIREIVKARVEEISDIIFTKNINLENFHKRKLKTFIFVEDNLVLKNFKDAFKIFFSNNNSETEIIEDFEHDNFIRNAVNLSLFGWKKEAVPIIQSKNSLITRIFKTLFG